MERDILMKVVMNPSPPPQSFHKTHLGKIPPELRMKIYHGLVATPPRYAGQEPSTHGISAELQTPDEPATPAKPFVHLQSSCLNVLKTCRQIYVEARPVFYARTSYYIANEKEFGIFMDLNDSLRGQATLRSNMITSLCMKDVLSYPMGNYEIPNYGRKFAQMESLRKLYLYMCVGEEMRYIRLLFYLRDMQRGVIEFLGDSHWMIRLQRPEEVWKTQYACFLNNDYCKGKGDVELSYDDIKIERQLLMIQSRAPGLEHGQERFLEVEIKRYWRNVWTQDLNS